MLDSSSGRASLSSTVTTLHHCLLDSSVVFLVTAYAPRRVPLCAQRPCLYLRHATSSSHAPRILLLYDSLRESGDEAEHRRRHHLITDPVSAADVGHRQGVA